MAISRQKKEELVEAYKQDIENSTAIVFTNYLGASVPQLNDLRAKLAETETTYMVVKNTLLGIALEQTGTTRPDNMLDGPNAIAFVGEDIGRGVSALKDWIDNEKIIEIVGALLEGEVLDAQRAEMLSELPTKEQMLAKLLGTINAPASSLVRMINAPGASLARVINAHVEKEREEGGE